VPIAVAFAAALTDPVDCAAEEDPVGLAPLELELELELDPEPPTWIVFCSWMMTTTCS